MIKIEDLKEDLKRRHLNAADYFEDVEDAAGDVEAVFFGIADYNANGFTSWQHLEWLQSDLNKLYYCNEAIQQGAADIFDIFNAARFNYELDTLREEKTSILKYFVLDYIENGLNIKEIEEAKIDILENLDFSKVNNFDSLKETINKIFNN